MKLLGGPVSPFARKVTLALAELDLLDRVDLVRSPAMMDVLNSKLMADNPLNKIPTLVIDDGCAIFDSNVICEYLDATYAPGKLIPVSREIRWSVLTTVALASGILDAAVLLRLIERMESSQNAEKMAIALEAKVSAGLDRIESGIEAQADREVDLSHITVGCMFGYLDFRFSALDWRARCPRACQWYSVFLNRPSAMRTTPYEHNEANVSIATEKGWATWR